jgi:hypothetical protein
MKFFFTALSVLLVYSVALSQQLNQIRFSAGSSLSSIAFRTDQDVLIRISDGGNILDWGVERQSIRYNIYAPDLQPFMGRVDYYGPEADSIFMGRIKSIGTCMITYYGAYEAPEKAGKLRSIGTVLFDYYDNFVNAAYRGKIRFAGSQVLEYYSTIDNEAYIGKLRKVGNTVITYYSSFDDKLVQGKIKSIGMANYSWYTSFDRMEYRGGLKSGNYRQTINGVTYILQ